MSEERFEITVPASPRPLRVVRKFLDLLAGHCPEVKLSPQALIELQLAIQEACINAIRYGESGRPDARVRVAFIVAEDRLTVEVRDRGPGFDPSEVPVPDPEELHEGGYGVHIMRRASHALTVRREGGEFVVSLTRYYEDVVAAASGRSR